MIKRIRSIGIILHTIAFLALGGLSSCGIFAPDQITITKTEISSSRGLINPITIEKLRVDSIGKEHRPVKYTIEYVTTCSIKQKEGKPPVALNKIKLNESGRYNWDEENVNIAIVHDDGYSKRISSTEELIWSMGDQKFDTCPLKFEKERWYFINFLDPQIVGVYIHVDKAGDLHQFTAFSGVSPI